MKKYFWVFLSISLLTVALSGCSGLQSGDDSQKESLPTTGPESEMPESETPESETPGSETPGSETLGSETPGSQEPGRESLESESSETGETSDKEQETAISGESDHFAFYYGTWEVKDYQSASVSTLSLEDMESYR